MFTQDDLIACLAWRWRRRHGRRPGTSQRPISTSGTTVFGGQILAQVVTAAAAASPDKAIKSLHILFPREGNAAEPMQYRVDTVQSGRTFATTEVVAHQHGKVVAVALVSHHADEDGIDRNDPPPQVGPPEDAVARALHDPVRPASSTAPTSTTAAPPARPPRLVDAHCSVSGARTSTRRCSHATDYRDRHGAAAGRRVEPADSTVTLHTAVTSCVTGLPVDDCRSSRSRTGGRPRSSVGRGDVPAGDRLALAELS
jgi:acyl-CoA thioesterase